jgi:hypothetical protein
MIVHSHSVPHFIGQPTTQSASAAVSHHVPSSSYFQVGNLSEAGVRLEIDAIHHRPNGMANNTASLLLLERRLEEIHKHKVKEDEDELV